MHQHLRGNARGAGAPGGVRHRRPVGPVRQRAPEPVGCAHVHEAQRPKAHAAQEGYVGRMEGVAICIQLLAAGPVARLAAAGHEEGHEDLDVSDGVRSVRVLHAHQNAVVRHTLLQAQPHVQQQSPAALAHHARVEAKAELAFAFVRHNVRAVRQRLLHVARHQRRQRLVRLKQRRPARRVQVLRALLRRPVPNVHAARTVGLFPLRLPRRRRAHQVAHRRLGGPVRQAGEVEPHGRESRVEAAVQRSLVRPHAAGARFAAVAGPAGARAANAVPVEAGCGARAHAGPQAALRGQRAAAVRLARACCEPGGAATGAKHRGAIGHKAVAVVAARGRGCIRSGSSAAVDARLPGAHAAAARAAVDAAVIAAEAVVARAAPGGDAAPVPRAMVRAGEDRAPLARVAGVARAGPVAAEAVDSRQHACAVAAALIGAG